MGHYLSEMISQTEIEEYNERVRLDEAKRIGAQALKDMFGEKAKYVAYFLHDSANPFMNKTTPERFEEAIERYTAPRKTHG